MAQQIHTYTELAHAAHDLKIFSSMNANEDKVLFLVNTPGGTQIERAQPVDISCVEAVAINGRLFASLR